LEDGDLPEYLPRWWGNLIWWNFIGRELFGENQAFTTIIIFLINYLSTALTFADS